MVSSPAMHAVVLAGGPPAAREPICHGTPYPLKALVPLAGRPMIDWVLDALEESGCVEGVVVVGLEPEQLGRDVAACVAVQDGIFGNLLVARARLATLGVGHGPVLLAMADAPLLTGDIVRRFVASCGDRSADVYFPIIRDAVMEGLFPGSGRTYFPARGGRYTGGNLVCAQVELELPETLRGLISTRKSFWKSARALGFGLLWRALLRRMTPDEAAERVSRRLGISCRLIISPDAELSMDVDRVHQLSLVEGVLRARS